MRILIKHAAFNERTITTKDGRRMTFREQSAALDNGQDFPQPFAVNLEVDQPPYPAGEYVLDPSSLYVDGKFNKLSIGRVKLVKAPPARAAS
jgi:hypothetical protein